MSDQQLKPCPFCGKVPEIFYERIFHKADLKKPCALDLKLFDVELWNKRDK